METKHDPFQEQATASFANLMESRHAAQTAPRHTSITKVLHSWQILTHTARVNMLGSPEIDRIHKQRHPINWCSQTSQILISDWSHFDWCVFRKAARDYTTEEWESAVSRVSTACSMFWGQFFLDLYWCHFSPCWSRMLSLHYVINYVGLYCLSLPLSSELVTSNVFGHL